MQEELGGAGWAPRQEGLQQEGQTRLKVPVQGLKHSGSHVGVGGPHRGVLPPSSTSPAPMEVLAGGGAGLVAAMCPHLGVCSQPLPNAAGTASRGGEDPC